MKRSCVVVLAACSGLLAVTPPARADILLPGTSATPPAQQGSVALPPNVVASIPFTPFSFDGVSGMYREFVSANRTTGIAPLGGLSFEYQFTVTSGVATGFNANDFAGWVTNVTFAPAGTVPPTEADRSAGLGDVINFTLAGGVGPAGSPAAGTTSEWLIVDTNSTTFSPNAVTLYGAGGSVTEPALGPLVPEPGTLPLALVSLVLGGASVGYRRLARLVRSA